MKTEKATDVLKAYFPEPGDTSPRAQAILELRRMNHELRTKYNLLALHVLRTMGHAAGQPHDDNTGRPCRFDPIGHDCCATCNDGEDAMIAAMVKAGVLSECEEQKK